MTPANVFEECVGRFWGIVGTRDYMRARYTLLQAMLTVKTHLAVEKALDQVMDMLRLNQSNNMGLGNLVPVLYLRLGKDQECYDVCRWYTMIKRDSHNNRGNTNDSSIDVDQAADVFEAPDMFVCKFSDLSHAVAITLLKIRLLLDVKSLQAASVIGDRVPQEILDSVRGELVSSSAITGNRRVLETRDHAPFTRTLESQVQELYLFVNNANSHSWRAMFNPGFHLNAKPERTSPGKVEEMQVVLQQNHNAWIETPGAVEMVRGLVLNPS